MCGRFALATTELELKAHFELSRGCIMNYRYNIAPSQMIPVIKNQAQIDFLRWGLIPFWGKDQSKMAGYINARAETLFEKPSFKKLIARQRCIIPATGYYEWALIKDKKQPFYIQLKTGLETSKLFGMAGIWEQDTCAIITVAAHCDLTKLSDRMPLVLSQEFYSLWLSEKTTQAQLQSILDTQKSESFYYEAYPVSPKINNPRFDTPLCLHSL
jgi:putative SOS response-associated peptidase YedK